MSKIKLHLKEEEIDELGVRAPLDLEVVEPEKVDEESIFIDETDPKLMEFVCSDELNELRDILIELQKDIYLLLLDNKVIVLAEIDDNNDTFLYCLGNDDEEFTLIKMPLKLDEILANNSIIQYTPANISDVHDKVIELFTRELEPEDEEVFGEGPEDNIENNIDINIDNDIEEEDEDEEDKINS